MIADFTLHMRRRAMADVTMRKRLHCLRAFEAFAEIPLLEADRHAVERFMDTKTHLTERTRYSILSNLSVFYDWAILEELIARNPARVVDRPKLPRLLPRPIDDADLAVAIEHADRTMSAWLHLASFAGLRCAEIAGLRSESVFSGPGQLRVLGKGRKERILPLHPRLLIALQVYGLPRRGHIFRRPSGGTYTPSVVSRHASDYFAGLNILATIHMCRHWFGSRLLDQCGDLRVVQELMGHEDISSTTIYTAFSQRRAKEAVLALGFDGQASIAAPL